MVVNDEHIIRSRTELLRNDLNMHCKGNYWSYRLSTNIGITLGDTLYVYALMYIVFPATTRRSLSGAYSQSDQFPWSDV